MYVLGKYCQWICFFQKLNWLVRWTNRINGKPIFKRDILQTFIVTILQSFGFRWLICGERLFLRDLVSYFCLTSWHMKIYDIFRLNNSCYTYAILEVCHIMNLFNWRFLSQFLNSKIHYQISRRSLWKRLG